MWKACRLFRLSGRDGNIDQKVYFFVVRFLLITKIRRLLAVFVVFRLLFYRDLWLVWLLIKCDHGRLYGFLVLWFMRRFVHASLAALNNLFGRNHGLLITPRKFFVFFLFVVLAQVLRNGKGSFFGGLRFHCFVLLLQKSVDQFLH